MPIDLSGGFMPLCGKSSGTWMEDVNGEKARRLHACCLQDWDHHSTHVNVSVSKVRD